MRTKILALLGSALFLFLGQGLAQTDKALLRDLAQENKKSVEALALYPEDARLAILESCKYPEVLIKMQSIHDKTSAAFRTLIEDYPRSTQAVLFDLTRYPGLMGQLVDHRNDRDGLKQALTVLPEDKRGEALGVAERQMNTLVKIFELQNTSQKAFTSLIAGYPAPAQQAFQQLLDLPEVVDILNEDLRFTVLVGDVYRDDPAWVIRKVDSLNLAVAQEHAKELEDWQKGLENDPQARQELQAAAREYADQYGYTDEVYDIVQDDLYAEDTAEPTRTVVEEHYYYAYPYWFGYPWWWPEPCWRPYPYWWYWGFYPYHSTIVVVHFPSHHFMHWYFYQPRHHHVYNHLSTHFVNHYYGHRNSGTTITMGVHEWRNQNRQIISDEWLSNRERLPERLQEFARFEQGRQAFNAKNPARAVNQEQYLEQNTRKYPTLVQSRDQARTEIQREQTETNRKRSDWAPPKEPVKAEPAPSRVPRTQPAERPRTEPPAPRVKPGEQPQKPSAPAPRPERPAKQPAQRPDVDEAKDYHRDRWRTPERPARETQPTRAPKTQPSKPAPTKTNPKAKPDNPPRNKRDRGG